jgi:hypothetical protein
VAAAACGGSPGAADPPEDAGAQCPASDIVVATSDYTSSELGLLALDGGAQFYSGGSTLGKDPALASSAGRLFWIDRYGGDVLELDPRCATALHGPWTTSDPGVQGSTDPQDVAVDPKTGELWIARFNVSTVLVKTPDGSTPLGTIDLSGVAGVNRNPYMTSIRIVNGKAYVALEMLNPYPQSVDPSYIVRLDVATALQTGKVEATLQLEGRNPFGQMVEYDNALYLADMGSVEQMLEKSAGIERVDLATFSSELIVSEADIGAKVDEVSVTSGCGTAIVMGPGPENVTSLISFDPGTGAIVTPLSSGMLYTDAGFELAGMAWLPGGLNVVGDRTVVPGKGYPVHVLQASSACALAEQPRSLFAPQGPIALQPVR